MAVLQGQLSLNNGFLLTSSSTIRPNLASSNGYLLNAISSLLSQANIGISPTFNYCLIKFLVYLNSSTSQYQQYLSSLVRLFGDDVKQSATQLIIKKTSIGVEQIANSTAESLFVGILLQGLKEENNSLLSNVYITLFKQYIESSPKPLIMTNLVIRLYMKIIYDTGESQLSNNVMTNYTTVVTPNQFNN